MSGLFERLIMIRNGVINDIDNILSLEQSRFTTDCWTREQWEYEFKENKFAKILVLEEDGLFLGYIDYWILFDQATINKICILENYEKRGLGFKLLEQTLKNIDEELCISTTLEVRVSNEKAINLYKKQGFYTAVTKPHYYDDGEDCYFMIRNIGG